MPLLKNIFKNQSGFSLASTMVAAGIMGGLALGLMKLMETGNKSMKTLEAGTELNVIHSQVMLFLKNPNNCKATFKDKVFGQDGINLARAMDETGEPDPDFKGFTTEDAPVRLRNIRILHPINDTIPSVANLVLPAQEPELDGWWVIVEFQYDKYSSEKGAKKIFGGTQVNKYELMKMVNFDNSEWVTDPDDCNGTLYHVAGEGKEYMLSDVDDPVWMGPCLKGEPDRVINECTSI